LERGINLSAKTEHKHRTRNNFIKLRSYCAAKKRAELIERKCKWFDDQRKHVLSRDVWYSWLMFVRRFKLAKKFLQRADNGMDRNQKFKAFAIFKNAKAKEVIESYDKNIDELKKR